MLTGAAAPLERLLARNPSQPLGLKLAWVIATLRGDEPARQQAEAALKAQNPSPADWQQLSQSVAEVCARKRFPGCP